MGKNVAFIHVPLVRPLIPYYTKHKQLYYTIAGCIEDVPTFAEDDPCYAKMSTVDPHVSGPLIYGALIIRTASKRSTFM